MALYTNEQKIRRDASPWTLVQGVLAPIQFLVFLGSAALVVRFLISGDGFAAATISVLIKTLVLYTIMITGCLWERAVFGRYLFAPAFFWEDFVSMFVLVFHTAYWCALAFGSLHARYQMYIALVAYAAYLVNATQFVIKLRAARRENIPAANEAAAAHRDTATRPGAAAAMSPAAHLASAAGVGAGT